MYTVTELTVLITFSVSPYQCVFHFQNQNISEVGETMVECGVGVPVGITIVFKSVFSLSLALLL